MITIIAPSTTMNFNKNLNLNYSYKPHFQDESNYIINILKKLSIEEISNLMNLSYELSTLNSHRYKIFSSQNNTKAESILAFDGTVFNSMNTNNFNKEDFEFANKNLRILSGLYGILKPLDIIEPYRLEMKVKLKNECGNDLYDFWKSKITNYLINELNHHDNKVLINLSSLEYLKSIDLKLIKNKFRFIDIKFKEYDIKKDTYQVKGLYAKKARGYMVSFIIKNRINNLYDLQKFNLYGYKLNEELSNSDSLIFTR